MSVATLALNYNDSFLSPHTDRGVSKEATEIRTSVDDILNGFLRSVALGESYLDAMAALNEIARESAALNWDGYGALPINPLALIHAWRFLRTLPTTLRKTSLSVDPDGEISFEWYLEPQHIFSVSIGSDGRISYAGLFGRSDTHGTEYFGDELPKAIMDNLSRLFSRRS